MKKKVLVIGATGALGSYVVPELLALGYAVDGITLDNVVSDNPDVNYIVGQATDEMLSALFEKEHYAGIVDFIHYKPEVYASRHKLLCENTDHLIFLSSYRTYADLEHPIRETSPSWLDTSTDQFFLENENYAVWKSKGEKILRASKYDNYTIVRPLISFSKRRFDRITCGAGVLINRSRAKQPILLPAEAKNMIAGVGWAGNVGRMMARLVTSDKTFLEAYTLGSGEIRTWGEVADIYTDLMGSEFIWVDTETYIEHAPCRSHMDRWMLECDRLLDRTIDNSKVLAATGFTMSDMVKVPEALEREYRALPEDIHFHINPVVEARINAFVKNYKG